MSPHDWRPPRSSWPHYRPAILRAMYMLGVTQVEVCRRAGMDQGSVSRSLRPDVMMTHETAQRLLGALGIYIR